MRRLIETCLILMLSLIPFGSLAPVSDHLPVILIGVSLCWLILFSPGERFSYAMAALYLMLWILFPDMYLAAPLMAYALFQQKRLLTLLPVLILIFPLHAVNLLVLAAAVWMSYTELECRKQNKEYLVMRDDFVQNDILQRRILKEEELNHQKNLEIAILKERNRISREIHDSVGHTISAGLLQIEAMKITAPEALKEKLSGLSEALSKGMEEVRKSLHNLHNESVSLKAEIDELIRPMGTGYHISLTLGMDEEVPIQIKRAVLSMLREALTNISRHSDANEIRIIVRELPQHYTVTVKDNGSKHEIKQGLGLSSMEEMARSLGGVFTRGWSEGFFVHMTLPKSDEIKDQPHNDPDRAIRQDEDHSVL